MTKMKYTKEKLVARMLAARQVFDETLARVPEKEMQTPILHNGWLVKDMLGHLGFWEEQTIRRLGILRAGGTPEPVGDMDEVNEQALVEWRKLSLEVVRRHELEAYTRLVKLVRDATPDELFKPGHFAGAKDTAFVDWLAGNTWEHYDEHLPELVAWLDGAGRP